MGLREGSNKVSMREVLPLEGRTIGSALEKRADTHKDSPFVQIKDKVVTFGEMNDMSNRVAHGLQHFGVKKGDNVCIMLSNCMEFLYSWFAVSKLGAVHVPINTDFMGTGLAHMLNTTESKIIVIEDTFLERLDAIKNELGSLEKVFVVNNDSQEKITQVGTFEVMPYSSLINADTSPINERITQTDIAMFMFTSGTTGLSKACVITHNFAINAAEEFIKYFEIRNDDVLYCPFPMFHADGAMMTVLPALLLGTRAAMSQRFSASRFWDEVRYYGATVFDYMAATLLILNKQPPKPDDADHPARLAWGVPAPEFWKEFEDRFKIKVATGYGLTDAGFVLFNPLDKEIKPGLCGLPSDSFEVRIFDDHDNEVPANKVGEIVIRPKKPHVMMEYYYNMPQETLQNYRNLWFHTGDLAYKDEEGFIYFAGRKKDAIRRRGENISAWELEEILNAHHLILESAAIGVPSELTEEDVKVCIALKEGAQLSCEELIEYCRERMPRFMVPRYVEFLESIPKTPTGKIEKYKLKETGFNGNTWDREAQK